MSGFSKIPPKWEMTHWEKVFAKNEIHNSINDFMQALQFEDIKTMERNLLLLDAAVKQLSKNQLAKNLAQNPLFI